MRMPMNNLPWGEMLVSALGGGGLTKLADVFFGRKAREVTALRDVVDGLSDQLKKADTRMDEFGGRLDECRAQHEECERGRQEDRKEIDGLKSQIDRLMSGEVAGYDLSAPKNDPSRGRGR